MAGRGRRQAPALRAWCEKAIVSIGPEPHPVYPPVSAIGGGQPFRPRCVHVLTPIVDLSAGRQEERLATEEERKCGVISPEVLNRTPGELQPKYRQESVALPKP